MTDIPWPELGIVAAVFLNYVLVEVYKRIAPDKPLDPRLVNAGVSVLVAGVAAGLSHGEVWWRAIVSGVAALAAFFVASGIHKVRDERRDAPD